MWVKVYCEDGTIFEGEWKASSLTIVPHREDGPAMEWDNGTKYWYIRGKCHREDGPAVEYATGREVVNVWWLEDKRYTKREFEQFLKEVDSLDPAIGLLDPREWVRNRWKKRMKDL